MDQGTLGLVHRIYTLPGWLRNLLAPLVSLRSPLLARLVGKGKLPTESHLLWEALGRRQRLTDEV